MEPGTYYQERVNRVLDYLAEHLTEDLSLDRLSEISCFSRFHFHAWLPSVDLELADRPAMEVFVKLPEEIGWEAFDLQVSIPVAPR